MSLDYYKITANDYYLNNKIGKRTYLTQDEVIYQNKYMFLLLTNTNESGSITCNLLVNKKLTDESHRSYGQLFFDQNNEEYVFSSPVFINKNLDLNKHFKWADKYTYVCGPITQSQLESIKVAFDKAIKLLAFL